VVTAAAGLGRTVVLQQKSSAPGTVSGLPATTAPSAATSRRNEKRGQDVFHGMWLVFEEDVRFPGVVLGPDRSASSTVARHTTRLGI